MKTPPSMHAYVAADAQGDQCFILIVFAPMMNDQAGSDATSLAAEAIAPDDALAPGRRKSAGNAGGGRNRHGSSLAVSVGHVCRRGRARRADPPFSTLREAPGFPSAASAGSLRDSGCRQHPGQLRKRRSGRELKRRSRLDLLAAPWPRTTRIAARGHGLLAAFDQAALAAILLVGALFGLAAHSATQPPERHRMRILASWLFLHDPTPSRHLQLPSRT